MTPTRIYVRSVLAVHRAGLLKAAAHITGGGLPGNVPRVLPDGTVAALEPTWPVPPVFRWLARTGGVAGEEMLRVFNCGLGMVLVVAAAGRRGALLTEGETVYRIGTIEAGDGAKARITFIPPPDWLRMKRRVGDPDQWPRLQHGVAGRGGADPDYPAEIAWCCRTGPVPPACDAPKRRGLRRGRSITAAFAATERRMRRRSTPR